MRKNEYTTCTYMCEESNESYVVRTPFLNEQCSPSSLVNYL